MGVALVWRSALHLHDLHRHRRHPLPRTIQCLGRFGHGDTARSKGDSLGKDGSAKNWLSRTGGLSQAQLKTMVEQDAKSWTLLIKAVGSRPPAAEPKPMPMPMPASRPDLT